MARQPRSGCSGVTIHLTFSLLSSVLPLVSSHYKMFAASSTFRLSARQWSAQVARAALTASRTGALARASARTVHTEGSSSAYENIIVSTVGAKNDVTLIQLNRPKAVRITPGSQHSASDLTMP